MMKLTKVDDNYFLADTSTPTPYSWSGKLLRKDEKWELVIVRRTGADLPQAGTALNPGSGLNTILREGPLLIFKGDNGRFVWRQIAS